jgi:tetratricopeptide (TPR) repeat protein
LLTPASSEWRQSLFDLARLLYDLGRYEEAIPRLEEAAARYPDAPRALEMQYLAADACHRSGYALQQGLGQILVESTRAMRAKQAAALLATAQERFEKLRETILRRQESRGLSAAERDLLRNAYLESADLLFEQGQYEEAVKVFTNFVNRFPNAPESLEAYAQIAVAYRRMNRAGEARGIAEQARLMLNRLKPDAPFSQTTNRDRKQWEELFEQYRNVQ